MDQCLHEVVFALWIWLCEAVCEVRGCASFNFLFHVVFSRHVDTYDCKSLMHYFVGVECMPILFHPQITSERDSVLSLFERL